jgi:hypothetical protein
MQVAPTHDGIARKLRDPLAWSIARPGTEYHIEPSDQHTPADLDPHVSRITDDKFSARIVTLDAEANAMRESLTNGHLLIGLFAAAMIGVICVATAIGAVTRIPAIEQQLAYDARV